jgi:FG-GAP repeat
VYTHQGANVSPPQALGEGNANTQAHCGENLVFTGDVLISSCSAEDSSAHGINGDRSGEPIIDGGGAYVFVRSANTWSQLAHLNADKPKAGDLFGASVALSGDTIFIGARAESSSARGVDGDTSDNNTPGAGAVFVLR